ncbi:hypothetical protein EKN56_19815 [Limnobaculum zhutongyuii]|uniref:Uncharacterized protein n=1 Tax=Limnobaculum zhutongyuii TaxID=2498113 RepID=A0A411WQM5_9GAMM|nr:hypothetical protein [Limnobaculum zhutongyuii]QBH98440.1 hypothetical protein EKN56_19815 [Limnobaculum zhutongyuii]TQS89662.1 hypothetical protein ELQ32_04425 [Limnobaculum zhutongyuii]
MLADKALVKKARFCIKVIPNEWGWRLANHKLKEAYGIFDEPPVPNIGDINGNFVCIYSDPISGDYEFAHRSKVVCHA